MRLMNNLAWYGGTALILALVNSQGGCTTTLPTTGGDSLCVVICEPSIGNAYPHWLKDGRRILFQSNRAGKWQRYTINCDGSSIVNLTKNPARDIHPNCMPDGSKLHFNSRRELAGKAGPAVPKIPAGYFLPLPATCWTTWVNSCANNCAEALA